MVSAIIYLVVMCLCQGWDDYLVMLHENRVFSYFVRSKYMRRRKNCHDFKTFKIFYSVIHFTKRYWINHDKTSYFIFILF